MNFGNACTRVSRHAARAVLAAACWAASSSCGSTQTAGLIEGDAWHRADVAKTAYGVKGAGVKVCVMSDSIDNGQGALASARGSHDIPAEPQFKPIAGQEGSGKGEGLAMLEIVHKVAPDANLGFATGNVDLATQQQNINKLVTDGCKIIVDDITNPLDAPFQDSAVARLINANTTNKGVLFISSAGNQGNSKAGTSGVWEGDFNDGGTVPSFFGDRSKVHQFPIVGTQQTTQVAKITARTKKIWLYWSDAWYPGPNTVRNSYVIRVHSPRLAGTGTRWVDPSYVVQITDRPAVQLDAATVPDLTCDGSTKSEDNCFEVGDWVAITKEDVLVNGAAQPSASRFLRLYTEGGKIDVGTDGTVSGRNAAKNVVSVVAVKPPTGSVFTSASLVEPGSSDGPRQIFYDATNKAITNSVLAGGGEVLDKPDLAAANRVTTTLPPGTTLNPFEGSSAAAPHVAGIAALVLSYQPNLTPGQVREILIGSAIDLYGNGFDGLSGYGIPMADKALLLAGTLQFGPKLALKETADPRAPYATIQLTADRSVVGWPGSVKASAIANATVVTSTGGVVQLNKDGTTWTALPSGSNVVGVSSELGIAFKSDGSAQIYGFDAWNGLGLPIPDTSKLVNAIAGAGGLDSNTFYFLKRDGTVERWALTQPYRKDDGSQPPDNLHSTKVLQTKNVIDIKYMIGSLPLAMLLRDGTVVTVDKQGNPSDAITYGGWATVARPSGVADIVAIAAGWAHVLALKRDGTVLAWGANHKGQSTVPSTLSDVASIAAATNQSYAVKKDGTVVSWGSPN